MRHSDPSRNRKRAYEYFQRIAWHVERRGHVRVDLNVSLFIWKVFFPSLEPRSHPPPPLSFSLPTFSFLFFYSLFFLFCSPLISKRRNWHEVNAQGRCLIKCQPSRHIISTTPPCPISFTNFKIELSLSWMDFVNKKLEGQERGCGSMSIRLFYLMDEVQSHEWVEWKRIWETRDETRDGPPRSKLRSLPQGTFLFCMFYGSEKRDDIFFFSLVFNFPFEKRLG